MVLKPVLGATPYCTTSSSPGTIAVKADMYQSIQIITLLATRYGTIKPILVVCQRPHNLGSGCVGSSVKCAATDGISSDDWVLLGSVLPRFIYKFRRLVATQETESVVRQISSLESMLLQRRSVLDVCDGAPPIPLPPLSPATKG